MRKFIFILVLGILVIQACRKKGNADLMIPPDKLKDILVDLYMVDGYYMMNSRGIQHQNDTGRYYNDVIRQHGYTRVVFDSTMKYYARETQKLDHIYDDVITELDKLQQEIYLLQQYETDSARNLFKKKTKWNLPKDGEREMVPFYIPVKDTGLYSIVVRIKLYDDDQSENPHLTAFFCYSDGKKGQQMDYFPAIQYKKSERFLVLSTHKRNTHKKVSCIKGYILNHDNKKLKFKKHIEVKSIIIAKG
jgi:hypothetical protein